MQVFRFDVCLLLYVIRLAGWLKQLSLLLSVHIASPELLASEAAWAPCVYVQLGVTRCAVTWLQADIIKH
jgi:hypothetical protein